MHRIFPIVAACAFVGFFSFVSVASAQSVSASLSPSGDVYPGTYLQLSGTISGSGYSGSNCWYLSVNGGSSFCWVGAGSGTGSPSFGWNAGSADPNTTYTIRLCTSNFVCSTAGSVRVVPQPAPLSVSASLSPSGDVSPGTSLSLSGSVSGGSGYSGSNCWNISVNGGTRFCWVSAGSGTGNFSYNWSAGSADPNTSYSFSLCTSTGVCGGAGSVRVVNPNYSLSVSTSGLGSVFCNGGSCASSYPSGTSLTLTASPSSGHQFSGWGGACSGTGSCSLTMNGNKSVSASFTAIPVSYTLSVARSGSGTITGNGINCGSDCSESFSEGSVVSLLATPASGWSASTAGWSGCGSVSTNQGGQPTCTVTMSSARNISFSFTQAVASAEFTNPADGAIVNYKGGTYFQWNSSNTTGCSISATPATAGFPKTGLPTSHGGTGYYSGNLEQETSFTLACTPASGAAGSSAATRTVAVRPPPSGVCSVSFLNDVSHTSGFGYRAWGLSTGGSFHNCPGEYFQNLRVSGNASLDTAGGPRPSRVFDFNLPAPDGGGAYAPFGAFCGYENDMQQFGGQALSNSNTVSRACTGRGSALPATGSLHFGALLANVLSGPGNWGNITYENSDPSRDGLDLFYVGALPWGNYNFHIENRVTGTFLCPGGNPIPIDVPVQLRVCAHEPDEESGPYYDSQCAPLNPNRTEQIFNCPGTPVAVEVRTGCPSCSSPTPLDFKHTLNVQSMRDGTPLGGVSIVQVQNSLQPSDVRPFEHTDFSGTTNYTRTTNRNYRVTLQAPPTHPLGGAFQNWSPIGANGCIASEGNRCSVDYLFTRSGGGEKTIIAHYSASLAAPEVVTATPLCTEGAGRVRVWAKAKVSGANSYTLHRGTSENFSPAAANKVADFTSANLPVEQNGAPPANPHIDTGLTAKNTYHYKLIAVSGGGAQSPASAASSRAASALCPDLVVERITLPASSGYPAGTVLSGSGPHTFSAVIKNQGEGTSVSFDNRFLVGNTQHGFAKRISGGLGSNTTRTITSDEWTADVVTTNTTRTIEVCADQPPVPDGNVTEAAVDGTRTENNNCASANTNIVRTITIIPNPITVELECEKAGGVWDKNYCVVDYGQASQLRWKTQNNPTSCKWVASDAAGHVTSQSYTVSGNPFSLTNLLNKLSFTYKLECSR